MGLVAWEGLFMLIGSREGRGLRRVKCLSQITRSLLLGAKLNLKLAHRVGGELAG